MGNDGGYETYSVREVPKHFEFLKILALVMISDKVTGRNKQHFLQNKIIQPMNVQDLEALHKQLSEDLPLCTSRRKKIALG